VLEQIFTEPRSLGLAQAAIASLLALAVALLARVSGIQIGWETLIAIARGLGQVVAVGLVIVAALTGPLWVSALILGGMVVAAAHTARSRAASIPGAFRDILAGIAVGSGFVIAVMTLVGVIAPEVAALVPVGSMIIANAMNSAALGVERFQADVRSNTGQIEARLSLGADPGVAVAPYLQSAVHASLIPRIDTLRSLGIVWIPGLMAGMILTGTDPIYAGIYQFVVIALIFAAAGLTSMVTLTLLRARVFSPAAQLTLRPSEPPRQRGR
jgi:putative ABC transport system permease protein